MNKKTILVTYHPVTLDKTSAKKDINAILYSLKKIKDAKVIFTLPNADSGNDIITKMIKSFVKKNKNKYKVFKSMGDKLYSSTMKHSNLVLGNSSSAIIEAPFFKVASINIGDRQKGRTKASSTLDCMPNKFSISQAIKKALSKNFKRKIVSSKNPYELTDSSTKVLNILKKIKIKNVLKKSFYDINF